MIGHTHDLCMFCGGCEAPDCPGPKAQRCDCVSKSDHRHGPRNPFEPIRVDFDIQPVADYFGLTLRNVPHTPIYHEVVQMEPIPLPEGLLNFIDFRYRTKK